MVKNPIDCDINFMLFNIYESNNGSSSSTIEDTKEEVDTHKVLIYKKNLIRSKSGNRSGINPKWEQKQTFKEI